MLEASSIKLLCGWWALKEPRRPEPSRSVARTVPEVIRQHVSLKVESIDRMYLNVYQPKLQSERGVISFLRFYRGYTFASSALMDPKSQGVHRVRRALRPIVDPLVKTKNIDLYRRAKQLGAGSGGARCIVSGAARGIVTVSDGGWKKTPPAS
jgi:hypothetical protein